MINSSNRKRLAAEALKASANVRKKFGYDLSSPVNIYDLCERAEVSVRFVEINMEGMYVNLGEGVKPTIFVSALRPFHRKIYTCAHEYGHHYFGHGMTVDEITESDGEYTPEEFLVDTFASYLLVPPLGLKGVFIKRNINLEKITPAECFAVACSFGVGYSTMVKHLQFNDCITKAQSNNLLRASLKSMKQELMGENKSGSLFFFDKKTSGRTIDIETNSWVLLPSDIIVEQEKFLTKYKVVDMGTIYQASNPGIVRVYTLSEDWSYFVRIQKQEYIGLSKYRHLAE